MRRRSMRIEPLESRCMLSITVFEHNDIGYFLDSQTTQVERYDIDNEAWLTPVDLAGGVGTPTVAHADDDGLYVAYGKAVYRYNLDGSGQTHLLNAQDTVRALHTDGNLLFVNHSSSLYARFVSINKTTNTIIDTTENYVDSVYGSSIAKDVNYIFGRSSGVSPSDITYMGYDDAGMFTSGGDSPYHGSYSGASTTWVFPGDAKVVDDSGNIYSTSGLTWLGSFGSPIDDLDFFGNDVPIVLNENTLTAYTSAIMPTGSVTLDNSPSEIFVNDSSVIVFSLDASSPTGYSAEVVPLSSLNPPQPGEPVDPEGLAFTPDKVEQAADGTVLLYSKSHQSIFCWDPVVQDYVDTIPLIGTANYMTYSSETNTVYLAYSSGLIRQIDLDAEEPAEVPFATLPSAPMGLSMAGQYVFACDASGAWESHYTFAPDGTLIEAVDWNHPSKEFIWSDANQKMYFFRDGTSPNDLLWEEINANGTTYPTEPAGGIGAKIDSPLHSSAGFNFPIRVAPDGSVVVLGSGMIHDGTTLQRLTLSLSNSIADATWLGGELFTMRTVSGVTQFQHWGLPSYEMVDVAQTPGTSHSLLSVDDTHLLSITIGSDGVPVFLLMDENLDPVTPVEPTATAADNTYGTLEDALLTGNVISDDTGAGVDEPVGELVVVAINGNPAAVGVPIELESGAVLTVQANGDFVYDPQNSSQLEAMMSGDSFLEAFEYTVAHATSGNQDSADVTIDVEGVGSVENTFVEMVEGNLLVYGTAESDTIRLSGNEDSSEVWVCFNDMVFGPFANPIQAIVFGGTGNDVIAVGDGFGSLPAEFYGEAGNDKLIGGAGADILQGGEGNDMLLGEAGEDYLDGGDGNDRILGGSEADIVLGGAGNDMLFGEIGNDYLEGGDGNDRLLGGFGDDILFGNAGNDILFGEAGDDYLDGGTGNNQVFSDFMRVFTPPKNMVMGVATVVARQAAQPVQRLVAQAPPAPDVVVEGTLTTSDWLALSKDFSMKASDKSSKSTKNEAFTLGLDPYADLD